MRNIVLENFEKTQFRMPINAKIGKKLRNKNVLTKKGFYRTKTNVKSQLQMFLITYYKMRQFVPENFKKSQFQYAKKTKIAKKMAKKEIQKKRVLKV